MEQLLHIEVEPLIFTKDADNKSEKLKDMIDDLVMTTDLAEKSGIQIMKLSTKGLKRKAILRHDSHS